MAIRKSDFEPGVPRTFRLPFGDAKKVEGKFGVQFMVAVEEAGQEKDYIYLEKEQVDQMIDLGMHKGAEFTFVRIPDPKSNKGRMLFRVFAGDTVPEGITTTAFPKPNPADAVWPDDAPPPEPPPDYGPAPDPEPPHQSAPTPPKPAPVAPVAPVSPATAPATRDLLIPGSNGHVGETIQLSTLSLLYTRCIQESEAAWERAGVGHYGPEQIQAGAATLFIETAKRGVLIPVEVER